MSYKISLLSLAGFLFIFSMNLTAREKLIHYSSGAFTSKNSEFRKTFECKCNRNYTVVLGVVNYTKSILNFSFRENDEDYKSFQLDSLGGKSEVINFSTLKSEPFSLELKAHFNDSDFKFASFDILIIEEE